MKKLLLWTSYIYANFFASILLGMDRNKYNFHFDPVLNILQNKVVGALQDQCVHPEGSTHKKIVPPKKGCWENYVKTRTFKEVNKQNITCSHRNICTWSLIKSISIQVGNSINAMSSFCSNHRFVSFYSELASKCTYLPTNAYRTQQSEGAHVKQPLERG